jgi:hypothetical protein
VAVEIRLVPVGPRGRALLDRLERATAMAPAEIEPGTGARWYYLASAYADVDAFDPVLDRLDEDWRGQLARG